jgi:uncharacterized protein YbjT (DUF2867 family)
MRLLIFSGAGGFRIGDDTESIQAISGVRWGLMQRILITGATGNIGGQVLSQLTATGVQVRVLVRNPEAARFPPEVDVVRGDLTLPETLDACVDGIDSMFLVWTAPQATVAAVLERIAKSVRRIVFLSAPLKTAHPFFQQPNPVRAMAEQIEQLIEISGLDWTFLRPGVFAGNARHWWAPQIRAGEVVRWPYLSAPTAPIDERDIAAVAVRALCEDGNAGAEYVLTGPQSLTQLEQVSTIGRVIGRSLQIEEISPEEARHELRIPALLLNAWAAAIGQPAFVTSTVAEIKGRPARTFLDWATDHAAEFRA